MKIQYLVSFTIASMLMAGTEIPSMGFFTPSAQTVAYAACAPKAPASTSADPCAAPERADLFFTEDGVAVRGTDVVAYFTQGKAVDGNEEFSHDWRGVTWLFASAEHRDQFAANPETYAPAYGGYCAWAVSQGYTAPIDPQAWSIVDDQLYLNFNRNIQRRWERDIPGNIAKADANWPGVLSR
ncbi:MAG: YHS domain-containing protein [Synechococcaceae cyanobacterium SM2_3_1]|nr:YHS domain-containing protein [Synechococcaceae cyanobacterium SM2_3_1]